MNYTLFGKIVALCIGTAFVQTEYASNNYSLIVYPEIGSTVPNKRPVIIGVITNPKTFKPSKNKPVFVYVDGHACVVKTNLNGVWAIRPRHLVDGFHTAQAAIKSSPIAMMWLKGTVFAIDSTMTCNPFYKAEFSDEANSAVHFPLNASHIRMNKPIIIGSLLDAYFEPVADETVMISLNGQTIAQVTSDELGVFSYTVRTPLCDGTYTLDVHALASDIDLATVSFTVDTVVPSAPTILLPQENSIIQSAAVIVAGTAEPFSTITTFMDQDTLGVVTRADANGNWQTNYVVADGKHMVVAQTESLSGIPGPLSQVIPFSTQEPVS